MSRLLLCACVILFVSVFVSSSVNVRVSVNTQTSHHPNHQLFNPSHHNKFADHSQEAVTLSSAAAELDSIHSSPEAHIKPESVKLF